MNTLEGPTVVAAAEPRARGDTVDREGRRSLPRQVVEAEAAYLAMRRSKVGVTAGDPVIGVALSGGGIRSATFNLGVLQEFSACGRLRFVDYLCTVSGGGYIGSCLSSLLSRGKPGSAQVEDAMLKREQVHHLRKHGDFLITRHGLFSFQVLRALGNGATGLGLTLSLYACLVLACAGVALAFALTLGGPGLETSLQAPWPGWGAAARGLLVPAPATVFKWLLGAAAMGAVLMVGIGWMMARRPAPVGPTERDAPVVPGREHLALTVFAAVAVAGLMAAPVVAWAVGGTKGGTGWIWLPAAFFAGARVGLLAFYVGTSWRRGLALGVSRRWDRQFRSALGALQGAALYATLAATGLALLPLLLWFLRGRGLYAVASAVVSFLVVRAAVPEGSAGGKKPGWLLRAKNLAGQAALALAVPVFVLSCLVVTCWAILRLAADPLVLALAAGVAVVLLGFLINYNLISPHYFYRDRLAEAYLRTERKTDGGYEERDDSELALVDLLGPAPSGWAEARDEAVAAARSLETGPEKGGAAAGAGRDSGKTLDEALAKLMVPPDSAAPYHLIACALNLAGSRDLVRRSRKSDHFVFSRLFCGSSTTGYVPTAVYRQGETKLARAMTISGAAASPAMGVFTNLTTSFALSLLNIRLGSWLVNPRLYGRRLVSYPDDAILLKEEEPSPSGAWEQERWVFWPKYLFREVFGLTDARDQLVHLSDGGHTGDNLGLYPLLQRRCDLIVACDGGYDPEYSFDSLAAAIRQIDVDENVKIEIDLVRLQPKAGANTVESHFGIGRIEYPRVGTSKGKVGWLLYVRASRLEDIPAAVASYWKLNPDFPYQSTADQFFDDDQFESYRALGSYSASLLTSGWDSGRGWVQWCDGWYRANRRRGPTAMAAAIPAAQQAPLIAQGVTVVPSGPVQEDDAK